MRTWSAVDGRPISKRASRRRTMQAACTCARHRGPRNEQQTGRFSAWDVRIPQRAIRWRNVAPRLRRRAGAWLGFGAQQCERTHANIERHDITANVVSLDAKLWHCASMPFPSVPVYTLCQDAEGSEPVRRRHRGDEDRSCFGRGPACALATFGTKAGFHCGVGAHAELTGSASRGFCLM